MLRRGDVSVGIEASADAVRMVAVEHGQCVASAEVVSAGDRVTRREAVRRARMALERQGVVQPSAWVANAPADSLRTAIVELPPRSSGAPIEELAASELARGADSAGCEVAVFSLRDEANAGNEYLVVGALREEVLSLVADCESSGIVLDAVDVPICSLMRACGEGDRVIVDVDERWIGVHAVCGGGPVLSRLTRRDDEGTSAERLLSELDRCAAYLSSSGIGEGIEEVILAGPHANQEDYARSIRDEFEIAVRVWQAGEGVTGGLDGPEWGLALGAAMWSRGVRRKAS